MPSILGGSENVVALCDVSTMQVERLKCEVASKKGGAAANLDKAKIYGDYRKLLASEKSVDAVVIAS